MNNSSISCITGKRQAKNIRIIKKGGERGKSSKQNISNIAYRSGINIHRISELKQILLQKQKIHKAEIDSFLEEDKIFQLQLLQQISKSSFSTIYKVRIIQTGKHCALKKVIMDEQYQRRQEIICKKIKSPFIVNYIDIFHRIDHGKKELNILMDLYDWNLKEFIMLNNRIDYTFFKIICYQMVRGLLYIHSIGICHRDVRPHNILLKKNGRLVICDFGSAKMIRSPQKSLFYMNQRSYRAPQLLLGNQDYTNSIDVWALGCVFSEILLRKEIFGGSSTIDTLLNICRILGSKGVKKLSGNEQLIKLMPNLKGITLVEYFKSVGCPLFIDLLSKMLETKAQKRVKMIQVIAHPFFDELREEQVYHQIMRERIDISHFFTFCPAEIKNNEQYRAKLIPAWRRDRQQKRISTLP